MQNNNLKGVFVVQTVLFFVAIVLIAGGAYYAGTKDAKPANNNTITQVSTDNPSIRIISPNGGETLTIGKSYKVTFSSAGDVGSKSIFLRKYSDDHIDIGSVLIGTVGSNEYEYTFTVPVDTTPTRIDTPVYKVQVQSDKYNEGMGVADESDGYINIVSNSPNKSVDNGKITIIDNSQVTVYPSEGVDDFGSQGKCGFSVSSPAANSIVKFPLTISGTVDNSNYEELGCRWIISEGQAATAQLYYNYKNQGWSALDDVVPIKFTGFSNGKATFSTKMSLKSGMDIEIGAGTPMKIVFTDVNEMDGSVTNTFELPINFTY